MPDPGRIAGAVVIPNCIQVRLIWTLPNGKTVYNVLHGSVAGGFTATATIAENVFTAIKAAAGWTSLRANLSTGVSLAGVDLRDLRSANQPLVASSSAAAAGTGAGTALPPGDALVVTLRTAGAGRGFRGRVFLPGFDSTAMAAGGVAAAGTVTNATSFVTAVQTALSGQSITLAIAQPARAAYTGSTGAAHAARAAAVQTVTSVVTRNNIFDHQRRRAGRS
jgi:hypothetical protein